MSDRRSSWESLLVSQRSVTGLMGPFALVGSPLGDVVSHHKCAPSTREELRCRHLLHPPLRWTYFWGLNLVLLLTSRFYSLYDVRLGTSEMCLSPEVPLSITVTPLLSHPRLDTPRSRQVSIGSLHTITSRTRETSYREVGR